MATLDPTFSRSVSGHVKLRRGKLRSTWYAKWRDPEGLQRERKLGLLWDQKGAAPIGYLTEKDAEAQLQAILTDARRGAVEQVCIGTTFDVVADEWLAWGIRDRDWKPSTLSDNRSVMRAHLLPAFRGRRIEKLTPDDIEQWSDELIDEHGASRRTANKCLIVLGRRRLRHRSPARLRLLLPRHPHRPQVRPHPHGAHRRTGPRPPRGAPRPRPPRPRRPRLPRRARRVPRRLSTAPRVRWTPPEAVFDVGRIVGTDCLARSGLG